MVNPPLCGTPLILYTSWSFWVVFDFAWPIVNFFFSNLGIVYFSATALQSSTSTLLCSHLLIESFELAQPWTLCDWVSTRERKRANLPLTIYPVLWCELLQSLARWPHHISSFCHYQSFYAVFIFFPFYFCLWFECRKGVHLFLLRFNCSQMNKILYLHFLPSENVMENVLVSQNQTKLYL